VDVFVRAAAQVKKAMDATTRLGGENFNFWGGREGYAFLPTTDLKTERMQEPSKHQYDWDVGTTAGFLREFGLEKDFKLNVECNHATLAGHSCSHEVETAVAMGMLGGLDANTGDPQVGWDTDQFMTDQREVRLFVFPYGQLV
jgi:xylose isomerase